MERAGDRVRARRARRARARPPGAESTSPMPMMPSSVWTLITRSSWLPSAIPSSSAGWRRMIASTSVIFTRAPSIRLTVIVNYTSIVYNRPPGGRPRPSTARSTSTRPASTSAGSSCRGRTTRAAGRTSSSRSSRSRAATARPRVVIGGVHGDEPEGQVAALRLARETRAGRRHGPADRRPVRLAGCLARVHAALADRRELQPLVPGRARTAPADEQLADFFTRFLFPRADVVVDMHSGGRSGLCPPWSEMHWVDDPEQRRRWSTRCSRGTPTIHFVYIDIAGTGLLVGEAERQGKVVVSTELGGGGHVTAATHRIAQSGLANVLRHVGVLARRGDDARALGSTGDRSSARPTSRTTSSRRRAGLWETFVDLGDRVEPRASPSARSTSSSAPTASRAVVRARATASSSSCARSRRPTRATTSP